MIFTKKGRFAEVEIMFKNDTEPEIRVVHILNNKSVYEKLCNDDSFDQRIWFYFQDEKEFQSYFNKDNGDEWFIIREITENDGE